MKKIILALLLSASPAFAESPTPAPTLNSSVLIITGNTFQTILAAANRRSLTIQNNNTSADNCWITVDGNASPTKATAILLTPGQSYGRYYPFTPNAAIQGTCASNNDTIYVDTQ